MARGKSKKRPERPETDAAKRPVHDRRPGEARLRGPEERTPGEDVLGEDLRASDELLGEHPRSADDLLSHAEAEVVTDRLGEEQQARQDVAGAREERSQLFHGREGPETLGSGDLADVEDEPGFEALREPEQVPSFGSLDEPDEQGPLARDVESGLEPTDQELKSAEEELREVATGEVDELREVATGDVVPARREGARRGRRAGEERPGALDVDPEAIERAAAWEHAPDLEKTSMILERGEGEAGSRAVSRPGEQAVFDPISSAAYDEPMPGAMDLRVPGAGITAPNAPARGSEASRGADRRDFEPPPDSVREVQRPHEAAAAPDDEAARKRASTRHGRRTKKSKDKDAEASAAAERPRRKARRSAPKREQQPGTHEAGTPD